MSDGKQWLEFICELSNIQVTPHDAVYNVDWYTIRAGKSTRVYMQEGILNPPFTVSEQHLNLKGLNLDVSEIFVSIKYCNIIFY